MKQWEYKTLLGPIHIIDNAMEKLGREGWELVSVVVEFAGQPTHLIAYLKRPKRKIK